MNQAADKVAQIREYLSKMTPGPWREGIDGNLRVYGPDNQMEHSGLVAVVHKGRCDVSGIVALRTDAEWLLSQLSASEERVRELEDGIYSMANTLCLCGRPDCNCDRCAARRLAKSLLPSPPQVAQEPLK